MPSTSIHGRPKPHINAVTVVHKDGNPLNCAAENLAWRIDLDWLRINTLALMRPDHLSRRGTLLFLPQKRRTS
jgi:hypothetical protein